MNKISSFFEQAATDPSSLGKDFTGPNYIYSKWIKTPTELGMSDGGSLSNFADNVSDHELCNNFIGGWRSHLRQTVKILIDIFSTLGQIALIQSEILLKDVYTWIM